MILFNCSCGLRHGFVYPCKGVIDINSMEEVEDKLQTEYEKDHKEEKEHGWSL